MTEHVLTLDCPEAPGIVHAVSRFLVEHDSDIIDNQQFGDRRDGHFYMRVRFSTPAGGASAETLRQDFETVAAPLAMWWNLEPVSTRRRVLIMVSKYDHCLNDLLFRTRSGDLPIDVVAVVSNHRDHQGLVEWHGIPFFHVPVTKATKPEAEAQLLSLVSEFEVDLVVLARYMQVLSDDLCGRLAGKVINIHHSFLPSFKGAKPYHQAHDRGVKLVGATAHYVTADLDEGPIIAQEVNPVDHSHTPEDLAAIGRDAESAALARAVRWHCEGRVFVQGRRTVVLR
ncbi:formyltetrahydrofolate deformylase [Streptomyces cavernicola]|uniref:Formyltetrahydrofolate deformylase n=1 Tax=Streptomyces cavernicola TaxID=3043613 RepID=A0ABT6SFA7_9ACTN|nr:formyltetrahydrofolate deformylase [Streptomyces sp. B-S-A6]MDI3406133.1 formyltetrahydrofolate deformylase [Streptomyces sp. B-S-A6]